MVATWAPPPKVEMMQRMGEAAMNAMLDMPTSEEAPYWTRLSSPSRLGKEMRSHGFEKVHVVTVKHLWTVDRAEHLAELFPIMTPAYTALFSQVSAQQRDAFANALVEDFQTRQGEGPFAVTTEALIAVGTKPRR